MRGMDFQLTEQQELIRKEVATLARSFSLDYWLEKDRKAEYPTDWVRAFAQAGWLGMIIPEAYGGSGLGVTEATLMLHEICAAGAGTSGASPRDAAKPFAGMTLFFTPFDRAKITVREIEKLGRAAIDSNEIFIDGLEIPDVDVVGEVGRGFYHLLDSLNPERIFTGVEAVG